MWGTRETCAFPGCYGGTMSRSIANRPVAASALVLVLAASTPVAAGAQTAFGPGGREWASATLQQCVTAAGQAERSATFAGEMTATAATAKMEMRIDVLERLPGDAGFHAASAPGLSLWRTSAPKVKVFKNLQEVTNLSAPGFYRAAIRFRWLSARGHVIKALELRTPRCQQPAAAPSSGEGQTSPAGA